MMWVLYCNLTTDSSLAYVITPEVQSFNGANRFSCMLGLFGWEHKE
jgi:hypothetical protein